MTSTVIQSESESKQFRGYPVHLDRFEGPLDLLLELIKQNKEDIWDISITRITQQYLDYIGTLQALEIEIAGEYLVMAATLMRVKSQMLLPRPSFVPMDEEDDPPLTREGLIAKLLEYRRIREAAEDLRRREGEQGRRFVRGTLASLEKGYQLPLREPRLIDLVRYFRDVLDRDKEERKHEVHLEEVDLDDQMAWVRLGMSGEIPREPIPGSDKTGLRFSKLLRSEGAVMEVVVTFLAVLELSKGQQLRTWQVEAFQEIWLTEAAPSAAEVPEAQWEDPAEFQTEMADSGPTDEATTTEPDHEQEAAAAIADDGSSASEMNAESENASEEQG
ncbi:MAG: segregation/condensation protein A [Candidatus Eisenbacteria bacterium]|uniref:Segregation and condensation protein A n=1 Tax=Eiseniibacteriota bacterium TaxID=2212470 RepID=A0A956N9Z0_UNCEI|nr:segregation/condensation protein A [Candidatus Eisenbacteria bacterium]MCB9462585.1 segregation/condensation protein A [Candidatus Eisenbacteria bacterium]